MVDRVDGAVALCAHTVITPQAVLTPGWVAVVGSRVAGVGPGRPAADLLAVDLGEVTLAPGFVDVHVHGAVGAQVNGADAGSVAADVRRLAAHHVQHGTTALLATTVSDATEALVETLQGIARCAGQVVDDPGGPETIGAVVLGAHLEGPWLSPARAGAHDQRHLRPPSLEELQALLRASSGTLRMVTIAPELPGALEVIAAVVAAGSTASVGHTDADLVTTRAAFDAGARHVTHLFNAMPALHHRAPGPVGAALTDPRVTVEVVADGAHLDPAVLAVVLRTAAGRVVAVTDSSPATGLGAGRYSLGGQSVVATSDRVVLATSPDTLAGSVLTMDRAVAGLVSAGAPLKDAVAAASATPARLLGAADRGVIREGARADLVLLDGELCCAGTVVGGRVAFDRDGRLAALR